MDPFHIEVVFAPGDISTAEEYSKRLGTYTERVASSSRNISEGQRRSRGRNVTLHARPLMLPQEVNELPYPEELVFMQPTKWNPALKGRVKKIMWYKEPELTARVDPVRYPVPDIPAGNISKLKGLVVPISQYITDAVKISSPEGDYLNEEQKKRLNIPQVESERESYEDNDY